MFLSPNLVTTDSRHFEIKLDADPRFAAAAAGGARYLGESSGLTPEAAQRLQAATLFACEEAFAQLDNVHCQVEIGLAQFPDRIEVSIVHHGSAAPSIGLHTLLSAGQNPTAGVDRVQYEQQGNASVTRLTKYLDLHS